MMIAHTKLRLRWWLTPSARVLQEQIDTLKVLILTAPESDFSRLSKFHQATLADDWTSASAQALLAAPLPLTTRPSSARGAEASVGVFTEAPIPRGRLVCLYPGLISFPSQFAARVKAGFTASNCTVFYDGTVLDSSQASSSSVALAHLCNHPPKGLFPNVVRSPFFWRNNALNPVNQRDSFPHPRGGVVDDFVDTRGLRVRGMGLVSVRDIDAGEEILVNYRLNPALKAQWPNWYSPVDEEEDAMRWQE